MAIKVKLFATLRDSRQKIIEIDYTEGITGKTILKSLNIDEEEVAIFLVNGRDGDLNMPLNDDSIVAIFPPVGGG